MTARRSAAFAAILTMAPLLSGCVAAALPVLAAGGMIGTGVDGNGRAERPSGTAQLPGSGGASDTLPATYTLEDGTKVSVLSGELPAPRGGAAPASFSYAPLQEYVANAAAPATGARPSALLTNPRALLPETRACTSARPALLVDLDPQAGVFDPARAVAGDAGLSSALSQLREQGVTVAWITARPVGYADAVRRALVASGLDAAGGDELVLLSGAEQGKQARRADFAKDFCVLAIAGDERADFDELYQYIKDPLHAAPLDRLIGAGWFLIPQPLS
ncbi:hypothetical protein GRI40_08090 [Altererythrobacter aerius]|uniref:Acid phosphatase n=1 Tax=Tsuneonella aeria TaxID=1837929 RepID=A0A6I4TEF8_9SPHN|nr:hypothetical protein [Tsuneonella aeria]MXO75174.1 hypothetical protein [Tsuneonella aeria]